jgi:hypothetical protein
MGRAPKPSGLTGRERNEAKSHDGSCCDRERLRRHPSKQERQTRGMENQGRKIWSILDISTGELKALMGKVSTSSEQADTAKLVRKWSFT